MQRKTFVRTLLAAAATLPLLAQAQTTKLTLGAGPGTAAISPLRRPRSNFPNAADKSALPPARRRSPRLCTVHTRPAYRGSNPFTEPL